MYMYTACIIYIVYFRHELTSVQRLDVVFDVYIEGSLKDCTRLKRGHGERRRVGKNTSLPLGRKWAAFLRDSLNKTELFELVAQKISEIEARDKMIFATVGKEVFSSPKSTIFDSNYSLISPCSHEEADTRMLLHAKHAVVQGHQVICLKTVDTDVVVLAVSMHSKIGSEELWIDFGTGKDRRFIPAHEIANNLGKEKSFGLLMFHSLSGCDTTSNFSGIGKKTAWSAWEKLPEISEVFSCLSHSGKLTTDHEDLLQKFVISMYDKTLEVSDVNEARKLLFSRGTKALDKIPPTHAALHQHILRSIFQALVWSKSLDPNPTLPNPSEYGWIKDQASTSWKVNWTVLPEAI